MVVQGHADRAKLFDIRSNNSSYDRLRIRLFRCSSCIQQGLGFSLFIITSGEAMGCWIRPKGLLLYLDEFVGDEYLGVVAEDESVPEY